MRSDDPLAQAAGQVHATCSHSVTPPVVRGFFHDASNTISYIVHDPSTLRAAAIDVALDFDQASGRTSTAFADLLLAYIEEQGLMVDWVLETHAHADHLSAASYLQEKVGGQTGIGSGITTVQCAFAAIFNETDFPCDGSQFDRLFADGETFAIGDIPATVLHVPGHTPADIAYIVGDAAFVGDTMFMPDYGSARCDFPGGDARALFRSVRRLMQLPDETRVFLCHDYKAPGRDAFAWETTIGAQRAANVHVREGVAEEDFAAMRTARDSTLPVPKLLLPAIQVNMRGGKMPPPEGDGTSYLKIPINRI